MPDQTIEQYGPLNKLISVTDRNGNVSRYQYDSIGRFTKFTDPVGLETTLTYSQGSVEITDPAARTTRLSLDANGNLIRITDPDGSSRQWRYDSQHRMTGETDQLGNIETSNYGFHGRVTDVVRKDGSRRQYAPVDVQGLFRPEQTAADPFATTLSNPVAGRVPLPESIFADINGNVTRSKLDQYGQVVTAIDKVGALPSVVRNSDNLPVQTTDPMGNQTWLTYDTNGNVLSTRIELGDSERPFGTALRFDSVDDAVIVPDSPTLRSANVTLESWVKFDSLPQVATILTKLLPLRILAGGTVYASSYRIRYQNGHLVTSVADTLGDDNNYSTIAAPWKPEIGRWHHVGMTFDDGKDTLTMYVDGVPVAVGIVVVSMAYSDRPLVIGADFENEQPARWFPGSIDEVRVWNVARTSDQIRSSMFRVPSENEVGLVASYSFDESPDTEIVDSSANLNHGTLSDNGPTYAVSGIRKPTPTQAPKDLVAWWSADGHTNDIAGGNNGALRGGLFTPGVVGLGLSLDGQDDYVRVTDAVDNSLDTISDFTIDAWINPQSIAGQQRTIVQKRPLAGNADVSYGLFLETDGKLAFTSRQNGGDFRTVVSNATIPLNEWSHIAVTIKGKSLQFYIDGVIDTALPYDYSRPSTNGPLTLGSTIIDGASVNHFHGEIDEVQLIRRALTSQEIQGIANADRAGQSKPIVFDAALDFSATSNPNGVWDYGFFPSIGAGFNRTLTTFPHDYQMVGFSRQEKVVRTENRASQWVHIIPISGYQAPGFTSAADGLMMVGGGSDNEKAAVVQWTAPQTGTYRINGRFYGLGLAWWAEPERRSSVNVLVNNNVSEPLMSGTTSGDGSEAPFSLLRFLQAGEKLQFSSLNAPRTSDLVGLSATIILEGSAPNGDPNGGSEKFATQSYTYDPQFNQLTSITDELGRKTLRTVDPTNGNVVAITEVVGTVGGADDVTNLITYTSSGQIATVTDPLGRITATTYDALGRPTQIRRAFGTPDETLRRFEYDSAGRLTAQIDENGNRTQFAYDTMNRLVSTTQADGSVSRISYDKRGNIVHSTDPFGNVSRQEFDSLDRQIKQTDAAGNETLYKYDLAGNLSSVTDPLSQVVRTSYDARNRPVVSTDASGEVTRYKYDAKDQLTSLQDARGNKTSYVYDSRGNVTQSIDPLGKKTSYVYDDAQQLIKQTDRLGRATQFTYNNLGELTTETWLNSDNSQANIIRYSYDAMGLLKQANDAFSSVTTTRDVLNRVQQVQTAGPNGIPTSFLNFTYDAVGNVLTQSDTINSVFDATNTSTYDNLNRVTQLVQGGPGIATKRVNFAYNALGQTTSMSRFADSASQVPVVASTFSYDTLNRLTNISHRNTTSSVLNSYSYQYDASSRITRITDIDGLTSYAYNKRDELTAATHADPSNPDETYGYDATGNRTTSHLHGSSYVVGSGIAGTADVNRLTSDGKFNYTYDANGNLTKRVEIASGKVREFTFVHRNRLVQITDRPSTSGAATQVVKYTYDLRNRRIALNVDTTPADAIDGKVTYYVYAGDDVVAELVDSDGSGPTSPAISMRYLHGPAVDQVLAQESANGDVQWMLTDHLGTVRDLVNNVGAVVNHIKYDSYGNVISESNPAVNTRYKYTGREFDAETEMQYNRARYYDAAIGRFISEDPIGFEAGDVNIYRYVANSPVDSRDPDGLQKNKDQGGFKMGRDEWHGSNHQIAFDAKQKAEKAKLEAAERIAATEAAEIARKQETCNLDESNRPRPKNPLIPRLPPWFRGLAVIPPDLLLAIGARAGGLLAVATGADWEDFDDTFGPPPPVII